MNDGDDDFVTFGDDDEFWRLRIKTNVDADCWGGNDDDDNDEDNFEDDDNNFDNS